MDNALGVLINLLRGLRAAPTPEAVRFAIVNESRRLVAYRRAVLLLTDGSDWRAVAASGASQVDRQAPLIQHLERNAAAWAAAPDRGKSLAIPPSPQERMEFGVGEPLWLPLLDRGGGLVGALWLDRPEPWRDGETALLEELADAQAHALQAIASRRPTIGGGARRLGWILAGVAAAALFIPVQRAALAPVEIVARDAEVVAAPIDGVIRSFNVRPNQPVSIGDALFTLDDTDRRARLELAAKALDVARVEHRQASQGALGGRRDAPKLAALEAQIALKEIELEYARQQLERATVRAGRAGVALLPDVQEYLGRPVAAGERVMLVADPAETEARAWLAVHDALPVADGAAVRLFLDADPLNPLDGKVARIRHEAEETPGGMAYRVMIDLDAAAQAAGPRVGARGSARIDGDRAPLFLYLFRRPVAALRQTIGF